jgi:muramoyltetrapeptide carboxypeptidase
MKQEIRPLLRTPDGKTPSRSKKQKIIGSIVAVIIVGSVATLGAVLFLLENDDNITKPPALVPGDTAGLISPASPYSYIYTNTSQYLTKVTNDLTNLGLNVYFGPHMSDIYGYLAGIDENRVADVNAMFANNSIQFIVSNRGGWGCDRILPMVDYDMIKDNPKIIMGYSDLTALLNAIHFKTGLITFHGAMGVDTWDSWNEYYVQKILFSSSTENFVYENPTGWNITTWRPGKAKGKLVGGNLSVFNTLVGTEYLPDSIDWSDVILFLEDVDEEPYTIDRMLTFLNFTILPKVAGVIFGTCDSCEPSNPSHSLSMNEVFDYHFSSLGVPMYSGAFIGHQGQQFVVPIGARVEMDATKGTIKLLENPLS